MVPKKADLSHLAEKWPSSIVAREKIAEFTGGALSSGRIANLDSAGDGPPERIKIGRKTAYPISSLIPWLEKRSRILG